MTESATWKLLVMNLSDVSNVFSTRSKIFLSHPFSFSWALALGRPKEETVSIGGLVPFLFPILFSIINVLALSSML